MRKRDVNAILQMVAYWSDDKLQKEYYSSAQACLGSVAELMMKCGFDESDIRDQLQNEKYISEFSDILETICAARGILLWKRCADAEGMVVKNADL